VLLGLSIANVVGVPAATALGQAVGVPATFGAFVVMACVFALFAATSLHPATALATVLLPGTSLVLPTARQMRLMDVSAHAQTLGAALNHSASTSPTRSSRGSAAGSSRRGSVSPRRCGWRSPPTLSGMAVFAAACGLERRSG
jgi:predicted MFS family arabinose efflux permease